LGNALRRDDGLGPAVVEALANGWEAGPRRVRTLVTPQLEIDLAAELADVAHLILVDARADDRPDDVIVERAEARSGSVAPHSTHAVGIPLFLELARDVYGAAPHCYLVMPKGHDFSFGEGLSERALANAALARRAVLDLVAELQAAPVHPASATSLPSSRPCSPG
jgi:hydrogenase maturation protease